MGWRREASLKRPALQEVEELTSAGKCFSRPDLFTGLKNLSTVVVFFKYLQRSQWFLNSQAAEHGWKALGRGGGSEGV